MPKSYLHSNFVWPSIFSKVVVADASSGYFKIPCADSLCTYAYAKIHHIVHLYFKVVNFRVLFMRAKLLPKSLFCRLFFYFRQCFYLLPTWDKDATYIEWFKPYTKSLMPNSNPITRNLSSYSGCLGCLFAGCKQSNFLLRPTYLPWFCLSAALMFIRVYVCVAW